MSDPSIVAAEFKQVLQKLEETHDKVILHHREQHARELLQLQAEHRHQLTLTRKLNGEDKVSLNMQAATEQVPGSVSTAQPSQASSRKFDVAIDAIATTCECAFNSGTRAADSIVGSPLSQTSGSTENTLRPTMLTECSTVSSMPQKAVNNVLQGHVSDHLKKEEHGKMALLDKFALARGWETLPTTAEKVSPPTKLQKLVSHPWFDGVCALAILLNCALLGVITNIKASTLGAEELHPFYDIVGKFFSCWFLLELALRWKSEGLCVFLLTSRNAAWNTFDFIVVAVDIFEYMLVLFSRDGSQPLGNLALMRMLRVLRVARALRVVRLVKFCMELRVMVLSIIRSGRSLMWSMVLMSITFYIFAIFLMQQVTEHLTEQVSTMDNFAHEDGFPKESVEAKLDKYFGTLGMTFYVLFQSVSGGISWCEVSDPLLEVQPSSAVVFCIFEFFTLFAMLNIITGFFVETAFNSVRADDDEVIQEEMNSEDSLIKQLHALFIEADTEKKGLISQEQFTKLLEDQKSYALMKGFGIQVNEVRGLFALLDSNHTGGVSIDDFIIGCMRLRGGAQEVDLISLMYETRKLMDEQARVSQFVQSEFDRLDQFEDRLQAEFKRLDNWEEQVAEGLKAVAELPRLMTMAQANVPAVRNQHCIQML